MVIGHAKWSPKWGVEVDYPGGVPTCSGPDEVLGEVIDNPDVVDDEVRAVEALPFTRVDTELLLAASVVLLGSGLFMVREARRWEQPDRLGRYAGVRELRD